MLIDADSALSAVQRHSKTTQQKLKILKILKVQNVFVRLLNAMIYDTLQLIIKKRKK